MKKNYNGIRNISAWLAAVILSTFGAQHAASTPILYLGADPGVLAGEPRPSSDEAQASFAAAAGPLSVITFEDAPRGALAGPLDANTTLSSENVERGMMGQNTPAFGYNTTPGGTQWFNVASSRFSEASSLTFEFLTPIFAFGAYLTGTETMFTGAISLLVEGELGYVIDIAKNDVSGIQFVGFTLASEPVSRVTFLTEGPFDASVSIDLWGIDDVQYSTVAPSVTTVPEPSSFALMIVGVALLLSFARRTRHALGS